MIQVLEKFAEPTRQSRVAIGIILIKFFKTTIKAFWPILLSLFLGRKSGNSFVDYVGYAALGFAALNVIGSVLTFFRYYFHLEEGSIVIDKGVLKRTKTNIPFERIQTINLQQNILHQIFGVVSLEIDTAGAKKSELTIDALRREDAEAIRTFILEEKDQLAGNSLEEVVEESLEEKEAKTILSLSLSDLFKIGVSQNHLRSMAILFAFVFSSLNEVTDDIEGLISNQFSEYQETIINNSWIVFLSSVIVVGIISFIYSIINTILKNFELRLTEERKGLKLFKGLLNREEISINKSKVQNIGWSDNPLRRAFKMYTLKIEQASSAQADQLKSKIKIPGAYFAQVKKVLNIVFPDTPWKEQPKNKVSILLKYRLIIFVGILPALIIGTISYFFNGWLSLWFLTWIPLAWYYYSLYYNKRSFEMSSEMIKNNKGTFGNNFEIAQLYKVQTIELKQSWYQTRKNLATVTLYSAAGSMTIPFIEIEKANAMENYILYKVESDERSWM